MEPANNMNINQLHKLAESGDVDAEGRLFEQLTARFRLIVQQRIQDNIDAEETAQDALTAIAEKYKGINFEVSFAAWAQRVLENKILYYYRTKSRKKDIAADEAVMDSLSETAYFNPAVKVKLMDCFKKINEANNRYARILNLHYQGYKVSEICKKMSITRTNLYSILSRARSLLLLCLERGDIKS